MNNKQNWPTFNKSMENSINYNNKRDYHDKWVFAETRYNEIKNRQFESQKIPKILHQIWLGKSMPSIEKVRCEEIRKNLPSDWVYKLWTEENIKDLPAFKNQAEFNKTPNYGQKSDILRLEILYWFGGVYCDTDFIVHKPFDELLDLDFFCGIAYDSGPVVLNSIMGSSPRNQVIENMLNLDMEIDWSSGIAVINTTGPYFITRRLFKHYSQYNNILALPNSFFYSYPNFSNCRELKGEDYTNYIKNESYCTHLWASRWMS